jgi:hypothetical protein
VLCGKDSFALSFPFLSMPGYFSMPDGWFSFSAALFRMPEIRYDRELETF